MKKAIGILGGMGPEASGYLYKLLIELAIRDFGAKHNDDFPEIILQSIPVPDFISSEDAKEKALTMLITRVKQLQHLELDCLSIACNTAHILLPELQRCSVVSFVSMITEVVKIVTNDSIKKVGILGTPSTLRSKIYHTELINKGIEVISVGDEEFSTIESVIRSVIAGKTSPSQKKLLVRLADILVEKGAQGIILGCTELPLIFPTKYKVPVYNSLEILAQSLLRRYYKNTTI